jgi:dihydrofolate reductase
MQKVTLVAAIDRNLGIGSNGNLPWHIKEDLMDFKSYTMDKPMILGRKSFESIGSKPLKNRPTAVITRSMHFDNVSTVETLGEGLALFPEAEEIIIGGGHYVYADALSICTHMRLTHIDRTFNCDTFFPRFNEQDFKILEQKPLIWEAQPKCKIEVITYQRIDIPSTKK